MQRTPQEIVELVVFGLIALLIGTGVVWLLGALFGLVGTVLAWLAALLWGLLGFLVPVALVAGAVVLIVRWAQGRPLPGRAQPVARPATAATAATATVAPATTPATTAAPAPAAAAAAAADVSLDRDRAADSTAEGMPPAPAGTPPVAPGQPSDGIDAGPAADEPPQRDA